MSALDNLQELQGQICYAKCCFCNTILLVGVPYSSSAMVVTISCGHCNTIFSLNMIKPSHLHTSSFNLQTHPNLQLGSDNKAPTASCLSLCDSSDEEVNDQDSPHFNPLIHKPPEKKQRAPTAYNHFIKQEIKRLKIEHPNMPHKKAFSAAAKNWAHYPQSGCRDGEGKDMIEHSIIDDEVHNLGNAFHETKALRQPLCTTTPFNSSGNVI